ncbi:putative phagocytic receptor 1b-like [Hibiscus syriacus]|uniref:Phagocytic receptor 1b-like n=1 Tax=Hibiscus syriacus TaxID=106335 RepID=A0A6A3C963_HIBSY|nr:putative phagocytic receptor 1b-like [Hibiscus syriacus]
MATFLLLEPSLWVKRRLFPFAGPNRAFGDLIAASGITDTMFDSLIALKYLEGVVGLPPLSVIEDMFYEKNTRKSTRAEMERLKLEEMAKERLRQVDDKGRAYGTGRRKCSIAFVWVEPGDGKFKTKTLGLWDIKCTVKGGGLSGKLSPSSLALLGLGKSSSEGQGYRAFYAISKEDSSNICCQAGAIQLVISRTFRNFEPELRPLLRAGITSFTIVLQFVYLCLYNSIGPSVDLARDSRVVERKNQGRRKQGSASNG